MIVHIALTYHVQAVPNTKWHRFHHVHAPWQKIMQLDTPYDDNSFRIITFYMQKG
jgi:hypothetical protein